MNLLRTWGLVLLAAPFLLGSNCSRARVESMNHMNEGIALAQQGRQIEAIEELERAASIDATNDQAHYNMALVHIELRKFDRAKEDLTQAIVANPQSASYQEKLGTVLIQLEDWQGAKSALERAIELDPNLFKAYFKLGQVLEQLDDAQNALQRYTEAIQKGPRFIEAYQALGGLYADLGYLDQAVQVLRSGLEAALQGTEEEASLHHLLGTVYQQQRSYEPAIEEFRAALRILPGMRDALFSLGWTYSLVGNRVEARRFLQKFVEVAGADAPPHYTKAARDRLAELGGG